VGLGTLDGVLSPDARRRRLTLLLLLVIGAGVLCLDVLRAGPADHMARAVTWSFLLALIKLTIWAVAVVLVVRLVRRVPPDGRPRLRALAIHLGASLALSSAVGLLSYLLQRPLRRALVADLPPGGREVLLNSWTVLTPELHASFLLALPWDLLTYWAVFAGTCLLHWALRARDRRRRAFELAGEVDRAQLHALEAQLHPHFLFNALHTISSLLRSQPESARSVTGRLRALFAGLLAADGPAAHPLARELALLDHYILIQKARFGDNLRFEVEVEPGCLAAPVPVLLLQPIVENAVRHGAWGRAGPTRVWVRGWREGGQLRLQVHDDGPGCTDPPLASGPGIGLTNTRQRLQRMYGGGQRLIFEGSAPPMHGARVTLTVPLAIDPEVPPTVPAAEAVPAAATAHVEAATPRAGLWMSAWLLFGTAMALLNLIWSSARYYAGDPAPQQTWSATFVVGSRGAVAWVLLFPLVIWLNRRLMAARIGLSGRLLLHGSLALVVALAKAGLVRTFQGMGGPALAAPIGALVAGRIYSDLLHYAVMVGLCHAVDHYARHVDYGLRAARLEAELAAARLAALRTHLQPQLLLATLARLERLIGRAPEAAERLLVDLGDHLRRLLRKNPAAARGGGG
jgi:two-component system, LytTR family, sensor kinase